MSTNIPVNMTCDAITKGAESVQDINLNINFKLAKIMNFKATRFNEIYSFYQSALRVEDAIFFKCVFLNYSGADELFDFLGTFKIQISHCYSNKLV